MQKDPTKHPHYKTSNTYRYSANEEKLSQLRGEWKLRSNWTTRL